MEICISYGGMKNCFFIPIYTIPIDWRKPGPGPVNYQQLVQDATILATISDLAKHAGDEKLRQALGHGIEAGLKAMQQHAGEHVEIKMASYNCG
jgi:hypothetical protein